MPNPKQRSRRPTIANLEAAVRDLEAKLARSERLRATLLEDGLRLSQENEALRRELLGLKRVAAVPAHDAARTA